MARLLALMLIALAATGCGSRSAADEQGTGTVQERGDCPREMSFKGDQEHENLDPAWSPDGTEIAFTTAGYSEIAVIEVRTCAVRRVTRGLRPTWSPGGKQIAFEREDVGSGDSALFVAAADGSGERKLSKIGDASGPDWSPSGDRVVFFRYDARDLYVARPDGSDVHRLTHVGAVGHPAWSPDGKRIAVECGGDASLFCIVDGASGKELRRIDVKTDIPEVSWSPDGETIAFAGNTGQGLGAWLLPLKTGRPRHLLPIRDNAVDVDWSPDGRWIAVAIDAGDDSTDLYLVHPDGTGLRRLTESPPG